MSIIAKFSAKTIREIQAGKRDSNGRKKVDAKEVWSAVQARDQKHREAIFGAPKKPKDNERKRAKDAADKWFSEWIRLRDAGPDGRVKCITCSHTDHWRYQQCGHFVTRGHAATRFNPHNANAQCRGCNYNGGQHLKHATAIDAKFGSGTADGLELQGRKECKRTTKQLWDIALQYKTAVAEIKRTDPTKYNSPTKSAA